ncbi:MAG: hypothetical protein AAF944_25955 [Bacteroidota bacterium]
MYRFLVFTLFILCPFNTSISSTADVSILEAIRSGSVVFHLHNDKEGDAFTDRRIIQYDEGNFGKINLHDLKGSAVTTYSPIVYVKRPKYISEFGELPLVDKQYKHNYDQSEDKLDSRYVYNYIDSTLKIFDLPEGKHLAPLAKHWHDRVTKYGVEEEPLYKRIKIARQYNKEILLNYRLNDVHWGGPQVARPELQSKFFLEHPEYMVNPEGTAWKDGALNFAIPEVRQYLLQFYQEGLNRFDNDGILIDMMRNPTVFPPGKEWEYREHLTNFLRQVRHYVDHSKFATDGRKMTMGVRVPSTLEYCESKGMDVRTWVQEGLVDFVTVSTFMKQDPNLQVDAFRKALGLEQAKVYATMQRRNYGYGYNASFGQYRGMAANMWGNEKADGLLLFNWMQQSRDEYQAWMSGQLLNGPHPDLVNELASLETLTGRNKVYSIAWGTDGQYPDMPMFNPLPLEIPNGNSRQIELGVFENTPENQPQSVNIVVQVLKGESIKVNLNGVDCLEHSGAAKHLPVERITGSGRADKNQGVNDASVERDYFYFTVPPSVLRDGMNQIQYEAPSNGLSGSVTVVRTDVFVSYGSEAEHGHF